MVVHAMDDVVLGDMGLQFKNTTHDAASRGLEQDGCVRADPKSRLAAARSGTPGRFVEVRYAQSSAGRVGAAIVDAARYGDVEQGVSAWLGRPAQVLSCEPIQAVEKSPCGHRPVVSIFEPGALDGAFFSKEAAREMKSKRFFSLKPCPSGHVGWRYARDGSCCECASPSTPTMGGMEHLVVLVSGARARAARKGLAFDLTVEDVQSIWPSDNCCPVLGTPFKRALGSQGSSPTSPTLDRICPEKGYVRGNLIVVSALANRIRNDASVQEIKKVAAFYGRFE